MTIRKFFNQFFNDFRLWGLVITLPVAGVFGITLVREWDTLTAFNWHIRWRYLPLSVVMHSLALGTMFAAWQGMMGRFTNKMNWQGNFQIYTLSLLARRIPLPIWYMGSRLYLYKREQISLAKTASATTLEVTLIAFSGLVAYLLFPEPSTRTWLWIPILILAGSVFIASSIQPNLIVDLINFGLKILKKDPLGFTLTRAKLFSWSTFYLGTWLLDGIGLYFTILTLTTVPVDLPSVIGISTLTALVAIFSLLLPGGMGLKELTMSVLLSTVIPFSAGIVIAIAYRLLNTIIELAWVGVGGVMDGKIPPHAIEC
ncbi:MAG: hypothetical protein MAG431_01842 [Chloroflexi bacterium]|nr:hypothetical protein [Chloroflexota bacterium]